MKLVRCKVCGYVMPEGKLGDRCPACGVPRTMFQPYTDPVSEARRRFLNIDLHPVAVHFPVGFAAFLLMIDIAAFLFGDNARDVLLATTKVVGVSLPVFVLAAGALGWVDARTRYRKIRNSLIVKKKIAYASALLAISIGIAVTVWGGSLLLRSLTITLSGVAVGLTVMLGLLGRDLDNTALPGR